MKTSPPAVPLRGRPWAARAAALVVLLCAYAVITPVSAADTPVPLIAKTKPVEW